MGLYFAMRRGRRRVHGMRLLFILLVWFVIQCARVTWLLSCLSFAVPLASLLGLWAIACYQIIRFVGLAVVDSISLALIRPLIACVDLVAATVTAITRHSVATLSCLIGALDRRANWVVALSEPALAVLVNALHLGYVGKKRRRVCDVQLRIRRALQAVTTTTRLERLLQTHRCVMVVLDAAADDAIQHALWERAAQDRADEKAREACRRDGSDSPASHGAAEKPRA